MTLKEALLILLGAVLGAVASAWYEAVTGTVARIVKRTTLHKRRRISASGLLPRNTIAYYKKRHHLGSLYKPRLIKNTTHIPILFEPGQTRMIPVQPQNETLFNCSGSWKTFPVNNRDIRWNMRRGVRLFDGELLWVESAHQQLDGNLRLRLGRFNYFAYATLSLQLQREMLSRWRRPRLHDRFLTSFSSALGGPLQPQAVGCVCATLFESEKQLYVAVAQRSPEVLNNPDVYSLLPAFGLESNTIAGQASRYGLTFYNLAREFCEEFFNMEELIEMSSARRADPDWIFQLAPAASFVEEADSGQLHVVRTGLAINPNDGSLNCALVAHFRSPEFFRQLRSQLRINWESISDVISPAPVRFLPLDDPRLDEWAQAHQMDSSSIFTLDLARQYAARHDTPS
jgi:hypothetical protein